MFLLPLLTAPLLEVGEKRAEKRKAWMKRIISSELHFVPMCSPSIPLYVVFFSGCYNTNISPWNVPCSFCTLYCRTIQLSLWIVLQGHQCFMGSLVYACCDWVSICGASVLLFFCFFFISPVQKAFFPPSSIKSREMTSLSYPFLFYMISGANYLCSCSLSVCRMREIDARKRKWLSQF